MKYNSLYITVLSIMMIFCNAWSMQESSTTEQKEKELLESIIQHPSCDPTRDYAKRPENYFKGLSDAVKIMTEKDQDSTVYSNLLNNEAIHFINYVAANDKWPTIENKLAQIKMELPDQTSLYLEMTLEHNQSKTAPQPSTSVALESQHALHTFTQTMASLWNGVSSFFTSILS
jgi:hypothetical protein